MGSRVRRVIVTRYTVQWNIALFEYQVKKQIEEINNNEVIKDFKERRNNLAIISLQRILKNILLEESQFQFPPCNRFLREFPKDLSILEQEEQQKGELAL